MGTRNSSISWFRSLFLLAGLAVCISGTALAQAGGSAAEEGSAQVTPATPAPDSSGEFFQNIYRNFYDTYRLGPGDEVAVRVLGQPDYSLPKVKVSPVGRIYHPLVGEIEVAGLTVGQLSKKLTADFSEYIKDPKVSVSLEEAQSAKIGVLGEIRNPGIVVMARPMTILEAISATGGFTDTAKRTDVTVLRQMGGGRTQRIKVDVKRVLDGKADPEGNLMMRAGDTVIVGGNARKKVASVMSFMGFAQFLSFIALGARG